MKEDEKLKNYLYQNELIAPFFLQIEAANIYRKYCVNNQLNMDVATLLLEKSISIINTFVTDELLLNNAFILSVRFNHPIYDSLFLALAIRENAPFLSNDGRLLKKCKHVGVEPIYLDEIN